VLSRPFSFWTRPPKKDAMKRSALSLFAFAAALAFAASACSSSGGSNAGAPATSTTTSKPRDAGEAIAYDSRLSTFATALNASGVLGQLSGSPRVTVFAPDNDAFARIQHAALVALLAQRKDGRLARFVRGHIVKGAIQPGALRDEKVKTVDGRTLTIRKSARGFTVSDGHGQTAVVGLPPIQVRNAVIYPINAVLADTRR
jgi:uncharacterized surface protein with fasciclin (FAS1) repeats